MLDGDAMFAGTERRIGLYVVPDTDHFDELNVLLDPSDDVFKKTMAMLGI